jgi:DNA-binding transcriptional LysR family regulator
METSGSFTRQMTITFRQLEVFVAAAKDSNFRRTADRFGMAQPSVSKHIRALEHHLGQVLFVRRRGIAPVLTFEGLGFLEKAQDLLIGRAGIALPEHAGDINTIQLTIMTGPLLLDTCIRPRLTDFCASYPGLALQFTSLHPSSSAEKLINDGDIDVAIFTGEATGDGYLQPETVELVGCSIYATPELARRASERGVTLDELPWVMPPDDFAPARFMWRYLKDAGIRPRHVVARSQFPDVVAHMALAGRGITVLFDDFAASLVAEGRIARIGPSLPKASRLLLLGRRARHAACKPVVNLLRQALRTPLGPSPAPAG